MTDCVWYSGSVLQIVNLQGQYQQQMQAAGGKAPAVAAA